MPVTANWERCKTPLISLSKDHPLYSSIAKIVDSSRSIPEYPWFRSPAGDIQCENRMFVSLPYWAQLLDLGRVTEKNLPEWIFRIRFAQRVGFGGTFEKAVWTDIGWDYSTDISLTDLKPCVGFTTNVHTERRSIWLKRVVKTITQDIKRNLER